MKLPDFNDLIKKYQAGTLSSKLQKVMDNWYDSLVSKENEVWTDDELENLKAKIYIQLKEEEIEDEKITILPRISRGWSRIAAAAVLIIACSIGVYIYKYSSKDELNVKEELAIVDSAPGGNRATLTLADGMVVDLNDDQSGIVIGDDTIKYTDGTDLFVIQSDSEGSLSSMLTLSTPKGGQYQITLPDGSKVWLNASSSLSYPTQFDANQRVVELTGEAYFDVIGQKGKGGKRIPFFVKTASQEVEVLGTQFNISAYGDEVDVKTTLIDGKVRLLSSNGGHSLTLFPGEQGVLVDGKLVKSEVDVNSFVSWKDGRFSFDGKSFGSVMRELERWYDIDIVYVGSVPEKSFYGGAYRSNNLSILMKLLRSADVDYRMDGKNLIIINKGKEENNK